VNTSNLTLPYLFWIVSIGSDVCVAALFIRSIFISSRRGQSTGKFPLWLGCALIIGCWGGAVFWLGLNDVFRFSSVHTFPYLGLGVGAPLLVGYALLHAIRPIRNAVLQIPQQNLIGMQAFRVMGVLFLLAMVRGQLPPIFALPAGVGDVLVGVGAIELWYLYRRSLRPPDELIVVWNALGILDLVVAISIGFFASLTPFRLILSDPSTNLMTVLPLVMVPVFGVPLYILLHITSLEAIAAHQGARENPLFKQSKPVPYQV
jgi:hypothetical protein